MSKYLLYGILLQTFLFTVLIAKEGRAQKESLKKIKLSVEWINVSFDSALSDLEKKTNFSFTYNHSIVKANERFNISATNKSLAHVLMSMSKSANLKFQRINNNIHVSDRKRSEDILEEKIEYPAFDHEISGNVTDENDEGLPGVNVLAKDTNIGTITDSEGNYKLSIPDDASTLVFSFVGYLTEEVDITGRATLDITLNPDISTLSEVVVVGYQSKSKENLIGSVAVIDAEQIKDRPTARLTSLLAGLAPGLTVTRVNPGRVGGGGVGIRIGGLVSRGNPDILVVIDGVPQPNGTTSLNTINPNDVESMTVLKDAEAVVYGSRAAGGVIVIKTKSGGVPKITAGYTTTFNNPGIHRETTNSLEMLEMQAEGWANNGDTPFFGYPGLLQYIQDNNLTFDKISANDNTYVYGGAGEWAPFPDTPYFIFGHYDWMDIMYGTAATRNYDLSASGSTDKTSYYVSLGVIDEGSMLKYGKNNSLTTFGRLKFEYDHNDLIKVGANINMRYQKLVEPTRYDFMQNLISQKLTMDAPFTPEGRYMNWGGYQNPIGVARDGGDRTVRSYILQPQLYVELKPIEQLTFRANFMKSATLVNDRSSTSEFSHHWYDETPTFKTLGQLGQLTSTGVGNRFDQSFVSNITAKYQQTIAEDHTIRTLAGVSHEEFQFDITNASRRGLVYEGFTTLNAGDSEEQFNNDVQSEVVLKAFFANVSYSYKNRYVIEGNYRNDGSSRFAQGVKWKDFYGLGAAWNVTNESFVKDLDIENILSSLKLRISWGQLGNQSNIGSYDFVQQVNIRQSSLLLGNPSSLSRIQTASLGGFASPTRSWEIAEKTNIGADIGLLNNRLNITYNYFVSQNRDVFYSQEFPQLLGTSAPQINGAHIETKGWDLLLRWNDKLNNGLSYYASFGISDANTKVITLADSPFPRFGYNAFIEGYPVGTMLGFDFDGFIEDDADLADYYERVTAGISPRLRPGDAKYKDLDGDGVLEGTLFELGADGKPTASSGDAIDLGNSERHYEYYFNAGVNYKGIDFSVVLNGVGKWIAYEQTGQNNGFPWIQPLKHFYGNTWTPEKTDARYPRLSTIAGAFNNDRNANNYNISNAPYVRQNVPYLAIKNIQIGYTFPQTISSKVKLESARVFVNATDLGYLINKMPKSFSPEEPFRSSLTPYPRTFSIGLNVGF